MEMGARVSEIGSLLGDPVRAAILTALMDGRSLPAGELAFIGNVAPQTASFHLGKLLESHLIAVERQGKHRYYRLTNEQVAFGARIPGVDCTVAERSACALGPASFAAPQHGAAIRPELLSASCRPSGNSNSRRSVTLFSRLTEAGWLLRRPGTRALAVRLEGREALDRQLGVR